MTNFSMYIDPRADVLIIISKAEIIKFKNQLESLKNKFKKDFKFPKFQILFMEKEIINSKVFFDERKINKCNYRIVVIENKLFDIFKRIKFYGYIKLVRSYSDHGTYELYGNDTKFNTSFLEFNYYLTTLAINYSKELGLNKLNTYVHIINNDLFNHELKSINSDIVIFVKNNNFKLSKYQNLFIKQNILQIYIKVNLYKIYEIEINNLNYQKLVRLFYKDGLTVEIF